MRSLITALIINAPFLLQAQNSELFAQAKVEFETELIDYGTMLQYAEGTRSVRFTNIGEDMLVITKAEGSCGCTVPSWPKQPIKPSESSELKIKYDTKRVGPFNKTVTVYSNGSEEPIEIRIKGTVEPVEPN